MKDGNYGNHTQDYFFYANLASGALSVIGCLFIIIIYFSYSSLRKLPFRLIFYLTISDLGNSIGIMMPYLYGNEYCQIQGYLLSYFGLSSILWCAFIAHAISLTIFHQKDISLYEWKYLFIGFIIPLLTFLVLIDIKEYQISLGWCWIKQTEKVNEDYYLQIVFRMICYYIPLMIVLVYIFVQHFRVIAQIKRSNIFKKETRKLGQAMIMKLKLYPLVMVGCLFPVILIRLISLKVTPPWYLTLLGGIGIGLNGFFNSIIYGLTQEVKHELSKSIFKHKDQELLTLDDQSESISE